MQQWSSENGIIDIEKVDPDESWLRGYFSITPNDGATTGSSRFRKKNIDFLRQRDTALHLLDPKPGMKVLDIGCAQGPTMVYCGLQGATVYGVDLDARSIGIANDFLRRYKVKGEAVCTDASKMPFEDGFFDGVISSDFFEHVTQDVKVAILKETLRVLKPGGRAVIKTPNLAYLTASLRFKQLKAIARLKNPFGLFIPHTPGTDDPQHIGLATRWSLRDAMIDAGFLNYTFSYSPLRRFGTNKAIEVLSTEIPVARDILSEDLLVVGYKPIVLSHFPD
jgi:2-polyprenyl-3-methyl-5-hydroxy-6-metoxy-1,4-benzoquinol methylase